MGILDLDENYIIATEFINKMNDISQDEFNSFMENEFCKLDNDSLNKITDAVNERYEKLLKNLGKERDEELLNFKIKNYIYLTPDEQSNIFNIAEAKELSSEQAWHFKHNFNEKAKLLSTPNKDMTEIRKNVNKEFIERIQTSYNPLIQTTFEVLVEDKIVYPQEILDLEDQYRNMPEHNEIKSLENEIENKKSEQNKELNEIKIQINNKKEHLAKLGIFSGKEKKLVREEINILNANLEEKTQILNKKLAELSSKIENIKHEKLKVLQNATACIEEKKHEYQKIYRRPDATKFIDSLNYHHILNFGTYNKQPLEWIVLVKDVNKLLLVTKDTLEPRLYNEKFVSTSWDKCTLRTWLNNTFINQVFNKTEKSHILISSVSGGTNPRYNTYSWSVSKDRIFLLNVEQAQCLFRSDEERKCTSSWWLCTPGYIDGATATVLIDGGINYRGAEVNQFGIKEPYNLGKNGIAIRPALWITLEPTNQ